MRGLVRRDVEGNIGLIDGSGIDVGDEPDGLGEGNGIGEGFGESAVARKLDDPQLVKLKWAEVLGAIVQSGFQTIHHAVEIKLVSGVVVDLEVHVVPAVAAHGIASGIQ